LASALSLSIAAQDRPRAPQSVAGLLGHARITLYICTLCRFAAALESGAIIAQDKGPQFAQQLNPNLIPSALAEHSRGKKLPSVGRIPI
jgi:hypothetical protein